MGIIGFVEQFAFFAMIEAVDWYFQIYPSIKVMNVIYLVDSVVEIVVLS